MLPDEDLVIGDWIRDKILGSGSFGVVSLWRNIKNNDAFAIKMCKWGNDSQLTPKHKERWTNEVEMMNQINHDNIIGTKILPRDLEEGLNASNVSRLPILCMEYCSLGDLRQLLNKPEYGNGLPENQVRCILRDMKNAISYLHSLKITHRDLKPENILLHHNTSNEHNITYKLIDLGYAKEIDSNSVCASFVGTLQYLAPELLYGKTYSNTVDYWSFGLVVFEVITGIRPFLPNLPPVQWMQLVKKKTPEQICVFENLKGEVEYSEYMFSENYISNSFKCLIEKWLKSALNWDSKKRGYAVEEKTVTFQLPDGEDTCMQDTSKESSLIIFSLLDSILSKKILTIFSVVTYGYLSYEIDDSTLFSTVQVWIERDTKVPVEKQMFLSLSCLKVNPQALAVEYWNNKMDVMLYFFQVDSLVREYVQPIIPTRLRYCLENPKLKVSFSLLLGVFTNVLHFIKVQKNLYETLVKACALQMAYLKNEINNTHVIHNECDKVFLKLMDEHNIISSMLEINQSHIDDSTIPAEYKLLLNKCKSLKEKSFKLNEAWNQLTTRLQSATRRSAQIHEDEIVEKLSSNGFNEFENYAHNYILQIRKISREERGKARPCLDAVKIVYKCLKLRDILLQGIQKQQIIQKIFDINLEVDKINTLVKSAGENANVLSQDIHSTIVEKEKYTVTMLHRLLSNNSNNIPTVVSAMNGHVERNSQIDFKVGEAMRSPFPSYLEPLHKNDMETLISENESLYSATEDHMRKHIVFLKSLQGDMAMDFDFLDSE